MTDARLLDAICQLSHEFGQDAYVKGGGGNSSAKNDAVLFIKPSGTTLATMTPEGFIGLDRGKINALYQKRFPETTNERESAVVRFMADTVLPAYAGRPSVEAPLHNTFPQRFVMHTHPPLLNGMTCGADGAAACARLFPDALWMPMIEPGYTLAVRVREEMARHREEKGRPPEMIFLANHGVFIAHDEPEGIRALYRDALEKIGQVVGEAGLRGSPDRAPAPGPEAVERVVESARGTLGDEAACFAVSGRFAVPAGALTPDHLVYSRARLYEGDASAASLAAFRDESGYWPRVVSTPEGVFGFGPGQNVADLALRLAWDGAEVARYAGAFGGVRYMDPYFVHFIENWEVESYRQKQVV